MIFYTHTNKKEKKKEHSITLSFQYLFINPPKECKLCAMLESNCFLKACLNNLTN